MVYELEREVGALFAFRMSFLAGACTEAAPTEEEERALALLPETHAARSL